MSQISVNCLASSPEENDENLLAVDKYCRSQL